MKHLSKARATWLGKRAGGRLGLLVLLSAAHVPLGAACAADLAPSPPAAVELPAPAAPWEYQLSLYGWATSLAGDVGIGTLPTTSVDVPFSEVLRNLDGALMGSLFAQNDTWVILTDIVVAKLSHSRSLDAFGGSRLDADVTQLIATGAIGYKLPTGRPDIDFALTAGARYMSVKGSLSFDPYALPVNVSASRREWWIDPTVGLYLHWDVTEKWFVNVIADIGGFGAGSKLSSTGYAGLGYMWTENFSSSLGYRYLYEDYVGDGDGAGTFRYHTVMHGPTVALAWRF